LDTIVLLGYLSTDPACSGSISEAVQEFHPPSQTRSSSDKDNKADRNNRRIGWKKTAYLTKKLPARALCVKKSPRFAQAVV